MSEKPSTSRERIIPIQIEGKEDFEEKETTEPCFLRNSDHHVVEDSSEEAEIIEDYPEESSVKRILPVCNVAEKIILVVDSAEDENFTPFRLKNSQLNKPLDVLKRAVEVFLHSKHLINKKHEFALVVLNANSVVWLVDFTNNTNELVNAMESVDGCETEDIFELNSLFDCIRSKVEVPEICELEGTILPPPYVVRVILFYGRSYTMPKVFESEEAEKLLKSPYFTLDVLMTHEPVDDNNNCNKIFSVLQNLDQKGFAYFFPVARDMKTLLSSTGKLLGHPLQRPVQKFANYSIKEP